MSFRSLVLVGIAFLSALVSGPARAGDAQTAYLAYLAAIKQATSVAQITPLLSTEYRVALEGQPQEALKWLTFRKGDALAMTNFKVTKESITGDKCILEASGRDGQGRDSSGKIELIRENGAWKLNDEAWVTPH